MAYNSWVPIPGKKKKRKQPIILLNKEIDNEILRDLSINVTYKIGTMTIYFMIEIKNSGNTSLKDIYVSNNFVHHLFIKEELDFNRGYIDCTTMAFSVDEKITHSNIHELTIQLYQFPKISLYHYISPSSEMVYHIKNCGNVTLSNIMLYSTLYGEIYVNNEMDPMEEMILTGGRDHVQKEGVEDECVAEEHVEKEHVEDQVCVVGMFNGNDIYSL
jgi:hypothetical protein